MRKTTFYWLKSVLFLQDAWLTYHQQWHSRRLGIKFCQYMQQPFLAEIWAKIQRNSALLFTLHVSCSLSELFMAFLSESPHSHPALSNVTGEQYWSSITLNLCFWTWFVRWAFEPRCSQVLLILRFYGFKNWLLHFAQQGLSYCTMHIAVCKPAQQGMIAQQDLLDIPVLSKKLQKLYTPSAIFFSFCFTGHNLGSSWAGTGSSERTAPKQHQKQINEASLNWGGFFSLTPFTIYENKAM